MHTMNGWRFDSAVEVEYILETCERAVSADPRRGGAEVQNMRGDFFWEKGLWDVDIGCQ